MAQYAPRGFHGMNQTRYSHYAPMVTTRPEYETIPLTMSTRGDTFSSRRVDMDGCGNYHTRKSSQDFDTHRVGRLSHKVGPSFDGYATRVQQSYMPIGNNMISRHQGHSHGEYTRAGMASNNGYIVKPPVLAVNDHYSECKLREYHEEMNILRLENENLRKNAKERLGEIEEWKLRCTQEQNKFTKFEESIKMNMTEELRVTGQKVDNELEKHKSDLHHKHKEHETVSRERDELHRHIEQLKKDHVRDIDEYQREWEKNIRKTLVHKKEVQENPNQWLS